MSKQPQGAKSHLSAGLDRLTDECVADILTMTDDEIMAEAIEELGSEDAVRSEVARLREIAINAIKQARGKPKPILTAQIFDGWPYAEVTIDPDYEGKGGENELVSAIFENARKWKTGV